MTENRPDHDDAAREPVSPVPDGSQPDASSAASVVPDEVMASEAADVPAAAAVESSATKPDIAEPVVIPPRPSRAASILLSAISGAVAAALVVGAAWTALGPGFNRPTGSPPADRAALDALTARVAGIESRPAPVPPDPATGKRLDAQEQALATLRQEIAALRTRADQLAEAVNAVKAAPPQAAAAAIPDLSAINNRLAQLEAVAKTPVAAPDNAPLRRAVAATLLDVAVRQSEPYAAVLGAARPLIADPELLKSLDQFAATGVPSASSLNRELIGLLPKLQPAEETSGSAAGFVDRFQASAERLIRIKRTDAQPGSDRAAILSRVAVAAQRGDLAEARRELAALPPADLAPAQAFMDKAAARDQVLAGSRQFAVAALAALPKTTP